MTNALDPRPVGLRGLILDDRRSGVLLDDHLNEGGLEVPKNKFDYARVVEPQGGFPMACNDTLGDCTIAGVIHVLQLAHAVVGLKFVYPGDEAVSKYYWKLVGHGPTYDGDPGPGLQMLDVIDDGLENGWFGVPIVGYAELDVSNWQSMVTAAFNFGVLYLAVDLPQSAETDFQNHKLWTPSGSPVGGHCITGSGNSTLTTYALVDGSGRKVTSSTEPDAPAFGSNAELVLDTETWGGETAFTESWWKRYGAQAFVIVPEPFVTEGHGPLTNVNVSTLKAACHKATAERLAA